MILDDFGCLLSFMGLFLDAKIHAKIHAKTSRLFDVESPPKWDMSSYVTCCTCFVNGYGFRKGVGTQKTQGVHHQ